MNYRIKPSETNATDQQIKDYRRGWTTSDNGSDGGLERADNRGESSAWYDGYMDCAVGRPKYFYLMFPNYDESANGDWEEYFKFMTRLRELRDN